MRIDIEDIFALQRKRAKYNKLDLSEVEFYKDGEKVDVSLKEIKDWSYIGMNNIDFILGRDWGND